MPQVWGRAPTKDFLSVCFKFFECGLRAKQPYLRRQIVRQVASPRTQRERAMPIYEFRCYECGNVSEVFLRSMDASPARCAICGSENLERLVSASYMIRNEAETPGTTCCGRTERCEALPCSTGSACRRK